MQTTNYMKLVIGLDNDIAIDGEHYRAEAAPEPRTYLLYRQNPTASHKEVTQQEVNQPVPEKPVPPPDKELLLPKEVPPPVIEVPPPVIEPPQIKVPVKNKTLHVVASEEKEIFGEKFTLELAKNDDDKYLTVKNKDGRKFACKLPE